MENATKALIIAGAILVAILIVTMGITLLNNTSGMNDSTKTLVAGMDVQQFNAKIEGAVGTNVTGGNVKTMLENVIAMKRDDANLELDITATLEKGGAAGETSTEITQWQTWADSIVRTARYSVTVGKDESSGFINVITITRN